MTDHERGKCIAAGVGIVAGIMLALIFLPNVTYSEGFRVGAIAKMSQKGLLWKTTEGELAMDAFSVRTSVSTSGDSRSSAATNVWAFSVLSEEVRRELDKHAESGARVKLTYRQVLARAPWRGDTDYYVERVEVLK